MRVFNDILIELTDETNSDTIIKRATEFGITGFFLRKRINIDKKDGIRFYTAGYCDDCIPFITIRESKDVERAFTAAKKEAAFVAVNCVDWKIIPLENLIAEFRRRGSRLYAYVTDLSMGKVAFSILEKGVDGIIIPQSALNMNSLKNLLRANEDNVNFELAEILSVSDVGDGERVCIDTVSLLSVGEGMLVGSRSNFFFFVHSESIDGRFVPPRPFRVNAGAVHSYIMTSKNETKYLCELEAGQMVIAVNTKGEYRQVAVGRCKIERRPMIMIKAKVRKDGLDEVGSIILQKAETIRLVNANRVPASVTELKEGDKVLVYLSTIKGRHIGKEVDEFLVER